MDSNIVSLKLKTSQRNGPLADIKVYYDKLYLADEFNHRILVFNTDGEQCLEIGKKGTAPGEFIYPKGIAIDSKGNLFITDCWNHRIQKFSPDGRIASCFGKYGKKAGELNEPFGIAVDKDDWIYVVERCNHRVHVFDANSKAQGFFGARGSVIEEEKAELYDIPQKIFYPHPFEFPTSILMGINGDIFVVDSGNHRIQRFTVSGKFLGTFGKRGDSMGEFQYPHGIAIDPLGNIFVSDFNNNRIQMLTYNGDFILSFNNLHSPTSICIKDRTTLLIGSGFNNEIKILSCPERKMEDIYTDKIKINEKDKRSYYRLGVIYEKAGNSKAEELLRRAFSIIIDDISIEDNNDDVPIGLLNSLLDRDFYKLERDIVESILQYFDKKTEMIREKLHTLKDELIQVVDKRLEKTIIIENSLLKGKGAGLKPEREEWELVERENSLRRLLEGYFLVYKRTCLKRYELLNILSDYCMKTNKCDVIKEAILKNSLQNFFKTCNMLSSLFEEKDKYEKQAETHFKDSVGSNAENWNGFQKNSAKANIIWQFLEYALIVSKISVNRLNSLIILLKSQDYISEALISECKKNNSVIMDISNIFLFFNSDWAAATSGWIGHKVKKEINIIEDLAFFLSGRLLRADLCSIYFHTDRELITDIEKKDYIAIRLSEIAAALPHKIKVEEDNDYISAVFKKIENIEEEIKKKEQERRVTTEELVKTENLKEIASKDKTRHILLLRKFYLLSFNYTLIKKELTRLFHIYKILVSHLAALQREILNNNSTKDGFVSEVDTLYYKIDKTINTLSCQRGELSPKILLLQNDDRQKEINNRQNTEFELKKIYVYLEYINFFLKRYEEIGDIILSARPSVNVIYDKVLIKFADRERNLLSPAGLAIDKDGFIYVTDNSNHSIKKITTEGRFIANFASYGNLPGMLNGPTGIAVNKEDILYVCDTANHRVQMFSARGEPLGSFGRFGWNAGEFNNPYRIYIDNEQNIYITEAGNHRVQKFNTDGKFIMSFGEKGDGTGMFDCPTGILVTGDGNILTGEYYNNRLQLFDKYGKCIKTIGRKGLKEMEFNFPSDITQDKDGNIYIAEFANSRIQVLDKDLKFKTFMGRHIDKYYPFNMITAISIYEDYLYILEHDGYYMYRCKLNFGE